MLPGHGRDLLVGRVGSHPVEEDADLRLPPPEIGPQDGDLGRIGELHGAVVCPSSAQEKLEPPVGGPNVAHPLGLAASRDRYESLPTFSRLTGVRWGVPVLRPLTSSTLLPRTLTPIRVRPATALLKTCLVSQLGSR